MLTIEEIEQVNDDSKTEDVIKLDEVIRDEAEQDFAIENVTPVSEGESESESESQEQKIDPIKSLRLANKKKLKTIKEKERRIAELEAKLNEPKNQEALVMPSIDDDDIDYDKEKFSKKMEEYVKKKIDLDKSNESVNAEWQKALDLYEKGKKLLDDEDFEEYESEVKNSLSPLQQTVILQASRNPALIVRELGKDPDRLEELETIKDPIKLALAVSALESRITKQSKEVRPEKRVTSNNSHRVGGEAAIVDRLMSQKTNDYSSLADYYRQKRNKNRV